MVKDTSEYRCLQSQFSVLYNESLTLKGQLDETRARLNTTRTARLRQLEHMEVKMEFWVFSCFTAGFPFPHFFPGCTQNDEVALQRKVRTEVFQLEDTLAQVRKEYEMLRIEFEQTLAANEQAGEQRLDLEAPFAFLFLSIHFACLFFSPGPINREMRHLISTLQTHNQQMKGEVVKYKIRLRETQAELSQVSPIGRLLMMGKTTATHRNAWISFLSLGPCLKGKRHPPVSVEHRHGSEGGDDVSSSSRLRRACDEDRV